MTANLVVERMLMRGLLLAILLWKVCSSRFVIVINDSEELDGDTLRIKSVGTELDLACFSRDRTTKTYWWQDGMSLYSRTTTSNKYGNGALVHIVVAVNTDFYCGTSLNEFPVVLHIQATPPSTSSTTHPTTSTHPTSTHPTSTITPSGPTGDERSTKKPNFKGVNPLIYTVIAVFLLGTLAVVAIVTCWIRARRSFYRQNQLPQYTTPRDYFDGISDSDFTPITASQFYASLRDAPPTYHESEVIQASIREEQTNNDSSSAEEQPPPLPPRNIHPRQTPSSSGQDIISVRLSPTRQQDDEEDEDFLLLPTPSLLDSAIPPMDAQM